VPLVSSEDQALFRSGVEMLLYLVKHSRPDIANAVQELSKVMDGATQAAMKEMKRVIKFVLDTRNFGLKIEPKVDNKTDDWVMVVYTDSDYAGDKDNWLSVSGFIIFLLGVPIMWRSKAQRSVSLSSAEAEFCSLSDAAKEIKFVSQVLMSMGISVKIPIIVRVDNVGAIFMTKNVSTNSRTKHIDVRYHFVREFVEEGFVKIIFVRSEHNISDGFTKNVTGDIYDAHVADYMIERSSLTN
jgi:hypothetical protein